MATNNKKACWKGYEKRGTKMKNNRRVNNCVKSSSPFKMKGFGFSNEGPGNGEKKAKVGQVPGYEEIKQRFKGKYTVTPKKGKINEYTLTNDSGISVSYKPGKKVKSTKGTVKDYLNRKK